MNDKLDIEFARANKILPQECSDSYEKMIWKIFSPNFIDCRVYAENAEVVFRPWPWQTEFLVIKVKQAEVYNK